MHPLQPAGALVDEIFVAAHEHPGVKHVGRWDPRLRHPPVDEKLSEMAGIGPIRLARLFLPRNAAVSAGSATCGSLRLAQLFKHIPPARAPLQREGHITAPANRFNQTRSSPDRRA